MTKLSLNSRDAKPNLSIHLRVGQYCTVGSSSAADYSVQSQSVEPIHCRIGCALSGGYIECFHPSATISVNGKPKNRSRLIHEDVLTIGTVDLIVNMPINKLPPREFDVNFNEEDSPTTKVSDGPRSLDDTTDITPVKIEVTENQSTGSADGDFSEDVEGQVDAGSDAKKEVEEFAEPTIDPPKTKSAGGVAEKVVPEEMGFLEDDQFESPLDISRTISVSRFSLDETDSTDIFDSDGSVDIFDSDKDLISTSPKPDPAVADKTALDDSGVEGQGEKSDEKKSDEKNADEDRQQTSEKSDANAQSPAVDANNRSLRFEFDSADPTDIQLTQEELDEISNTELTDDVPGTSLSDASNDEDSSDSPNSLVDGVEVAHKHWKWSGSKAEIAFRTLLDQRSHPPNIYECRDGQLMMASLEDLTAEALSDRKSAVYLISDLSLNDLTLLLLQKRWTDRIGHPQAIAMFLALSPRRLVREFFGSVDACLLVNERELELFRLNETI